MEEICNLLLILSHKKQVSLLFAFIKEYKHLIEKMDEYQIFLNLEKYCDNHDDNDYYADWSEASSIYKLEIDGIKSESKLYLADSVYFLVSYVREEYIASTSIKSIMKGIILAAIDPRSFKTAEQYTLAKNEKIEYYKREVLKQLTNIEILTLGDIV